MISILIPVYNFDVRPLVVALDQQAAQIGIEVEILCFDDGSTEVFKTKNASLGSINSVVYRELPQNVGRSRIRNLLAEAAKGEYLLFMDGDSGVCHPDYLAQYASALQAHRVLYGGRVYDNTPPDNPGYLLHWLYGRNREQTTAAQRQQAPYHSFMTNNFLMAKTDYMAIRMDERLREYGHEDTLFGMELQKRGIPVLHLDNPLEHLGLEMAADFLRKSEQALANLLWLEQSGIHLQTRLLSVFRKLKRAGLLPVFYAAGFVFLSLLKRNLLGKRPSLLLFDVYKLLKIIYISMDKKPTL